MELRPRSPVVTVHYVWTMPISLQFTVLRCCVAEQRMFRASNSSVLFHFMLLLGLFMAGVTLGFHFYLQEVKYDINMYSFALTFRKYTIYMQQHTVIYIYWCCYKYIVCLWRWEKNHLSLFYPSRSSCGPFENGQTLSKVAKVCVDSLPSAAQTVLNYLASEAFALPLILAEV